MDRSFSEREIKNLYLKVKEGIDNRYARHMFAVNLLEFFEQEEWKAYKELREHNQRILQGS